MKFNSPIIKLSLAVIASFTVVACSGTTVKLPESQPAQLNMHRGSTVAISYSGALSDQVTDKLISLIRSDGYYTHVNNYYPNPQYSISVNDIDQVSVSCVIRAGRRGPVLWRDSNVDMSWGEIFSKGSLADNFAQHIYHTFVPHESTYKVRMKADSKKNPTLAQAVAMAKAAQWDQAKALASKAIQEHPEDPEGYFVLGTLLRNDSRFNESDAMIRKALSMAPQDGRYKYALEKNQQMRRAESHVVSQLRGN